MATAFSPTERMRLARKTSSIDQLSKQFRQQVAALTGEQEKAFSTYQAGVTEKMAPFESALAQYQTKDYPAYEAAAEAYKGRLQAYESQLAEIRANPTVKAIGYVEERTPRYGAVGGLLSKVGLGKIVGYDVRQVPYEYDEPRPLPTFTETAPTAPAAPTRPQIAAFSDEPFQARRAELEQGLQRELGERRSARLAAVSRRSRNMLSGA